jgi:quercetin dioxygenase-like cupin family protein
MRKLIRASLIAIVAVSLNAIADEMRSQPKRSILERHDQSGVANMEIVVGTALIPSRTAIGYRLHPGDEVGYVLKGTLTLQTRGQADRVLHAGDSFFNVRGAVHRIAAEAGGESGTVVSTWIVDKGVPLATRVP